MKVVNDLAQARSLARGKVGLVPTMGFFHEGHLSLMKRSAAECDQTVVTLYVNPLQFEDPDDLARYPSDRDRDLELAEEAGADITALCSTEEMFPVPPLTRVSVSGLGETLEGECRPGHLTGAATVVAKLFAAVQPDRAYFGRKDAQQLAVVSRMARDLDFPAQVVGCPLIREADGLALSSRNVFLGEDRPAALGLWRGLSAAADAVEAGERRPRRAEDLVRAAARGLELEYAAAVDADTFEPADRLRGEVVLAAAARAGSVRLIDNVRLAVNGGEAVADRGESLTEPSILYQAGKGGG